MRKGWVVALAFALLGSVSWAEDEIEVLRAKLAAQEARMTNQDARMRDLEAKMMSARGTQSCAPEGITSLRKNAVVTVGGFASPSYTGLNYKIDSIRDNYGINQGDGYKKRAEAKTGSLEFVEAEVHVGIQIGDNIDGFAAIDLNAAHTGANWGVAKEYWVRWKNICNTGFGIKAGRDYAAFGGIANGYMDSYATIGDGVSWVWDGAFGANPNVLGNAANGMALGSMPLHNYSLMKGVTQITPYWESQDGKLKVELSFIQNIDVLGHGGYGGYVGGLTYTSTNHEPWRTRSVNYGFGSMSSKIAWSPIEGLQIIGSVMNLYKTGFDDFFSTIGYSGLRDTDAELGKNNFSTYLGFEWRPCFLPKLKTWGQWVHGWNVANIKDLDSDAFNLGVSWDFTDKFTVFVQGDYLVSDYDGRGRVTRNHYDNEGKAWASYVGAQYDFGNGLSLEAGWRHENIKFKENGHRASKISGDLYYASLLISF